MAVNEQKLLEDLSRHIMPGKCVAFLGSGVSHEVFGTWEDLIEPLCKACGVTFSAPDMHRENYMMDAAEAARNANEHAYYDYLAQYFTRHRLTDPIYDALMRIPFRSYATLNFDPLLALEARKPEHNYTVMKYPSLNPAGLGRRTVYYLHGLIHENEPLGQDSVVLTTSDYFEAYGDNSPLLNFLISIFTYYKIIFIGCGLREPVFKKVFRICNAHQEKIQRLGRGSLPARMILLPKLKAFTTKGGIGPKWDPHSAKAEEDKETSFYNGYDVEVKRYDPLDGSHSGLFRLFEQLAELPRPKIEFSFGEEEA